MKYIDGKHHLCGDCKNFYHCKKDFDNMDTKKHMVNYFYIKVEHTTVRQCPEFIPDTDCKNCKHKEKQCNFAYGTDCPVYSTLLERKIRRKYNLEQLTIATKGDRMV